MMDPFVLLLSVLALICLWALLEAYAFKRRVDARVRRENDLKKRIAEYNKRRGR